MKTRLILIGGFLGAGKTTLIRDVARKLIHNGKRIGLVTNDQAPDLVDTAILSHVSRNVKEVSGSCFCCNFQGFIDAISGVREDTDIDIVIAEPVGSCTDLSATIIQPLKHHMNADLINSPLSVLVDPLRLIDILDGGTGGLHPSAAYIFKKQIEEADIMVVNKIDILTMSDVKALNNRLSQLFPTKNIFMLSAKTGDGIDIWLDFVIANSDSGKHIADVDYDVYAEGEALLGWLNASIMLQGRPMDWNIFADKFLHNLSEQFDNQEASVGHVKLIIETPNHFLIGNLTGKRDTIRLWGAVGISTEAKLTLNARVQMEPNTLSRVIRETLDSTSKGYVSATPLAWRSLSPGRPNPTYRYNQPIEVIAA